jgi:hypothetical protein
VLQVPFLQVTRAASSQSHLEFDRRTQKCQE